MMTRIASKVPNRDSFRLWNVSDTFNSCQSPSVEELSHTTQKVFAANEWEMCPWLITKMIHKNDENFIPTDESFLKY